MPYTVHITTTEYSLLSNTWWLISYKRVDRIYEPSKNRHRTVTTKQTQIALIKMERIRIQRTHQLCWFSSTGKIHRSTFLLTKRSVFFSTFICDMIHLLERFCSMAVFSWTNENQHTKFQFFYSLNCTTPSFIITVIIVVKCFHTNTLHINNSSARIIFFSILTIGTEQREYREKG